MTTRARHDLSPDLPLQLHDLHGSMPVGAPLTLTVDVPPGAPDDPSFAEGIVVGGGFVVDDVSVRPGRRRSFDVRAIRARTLADTVGPHMRLLLCGLNPSVYSADAGAGFARPGNRFWPAALAAGVVTTTHEPRRVLREDGVGMTDLVKRATPRADELANDEFRAGLARVDRLAAWLEPGAICFVGLAGWRVAVHRGATAGPQEQPLGGRPVYVMPNTSGINASSTLADLTAHLRAALALARGA